MIRFLVHLLEDMFHVKQGRLPVISMFVVSRETTRFANLPLSGWAAAL